VPQDPHLSIEARLTSTAGTMVVLSPPPAAPPAGTSVAGLATTDDRGLRIDAQHTGPTWAITVPQSGAIRFRYRLDLHRRVPDGSTGSGMDSLCLYAVTRSVFVAPDPTAYRKTGRVYPFIVVHLIIPDGWRAIAGWPEHGGNYYPADGDDLLGAALATAPDFRFYRGNVNRSGWQLAIRGTRYFTDSSLISTIQASLGRSADLLGPVPEQTITYISDPGRKGRTSGSLQGHSSIGLIWEPSEVLEIGRSHDIFHETLHLWFGGAMESERWWIEGVTDYVAARLYAGWKNDPGDLAYLCYQSLRNYQGIEHNTRLTMAEENRQRIGGDNTELLVYRKGMLAGLLLDAAIRRGSSGRRTLDDLSRQLLALAATRRSRNVRENEIHDAAVVLGGGEVERMWAKVVTGTELLTEDDVTSALQTVTGRAFNPPPLAKGRKELAH
jgi:predicted metalloprotease with PDZ domain